MERILTDEQAEAINKIAGHNGFDAAAALEAGAAADEQMEAMRAENARLREALEKISNGNTMASRGLRTWTLGEVLQEHYKIARAALARP